MPISFNIKHYFVKRKSNINKFLKNIENRMKNQQDNCIDKKIIANQKEGKIINYNNRIKN